MIKVVLDTNVVVSAYLVPAGKPAEILSLARKGKLHIFLSREIVDEIKQTLLSPKLKKIHRNTPNQIGLFIRAFSKVATVTPGKKSVDFIFLWLIVLVMFSMMGYFLFGDCNAYSGSK